jgi:hypothetical protein
MKLGARMRWSIGRRRAATSAPPSSMLRRGRRFGSSAQEAKDAVSRVAGKARDLRRRFLA